MADKNFVVKNGLVVNTNLIFANGESKYVGINNTSPDAALTVTGSANVSGDVAFGAQLAVSGAITTSSNVAVGANVLVNTSAIFVGNSTVNTTQNSSILSVSNSSTSSNLSSSDLRIGATVVNASVVTVGTNARINTTAVYVGNSTANLVANSTSVFVGNSSVNLVANSSTVIFNNATVVNSSSFTGTAANATLFNNQLPSYYANAENLTSGTLPNARLSSQVVNTSGNFTLSGDITFTGANIAVSGNVNLTGAFVNVASAFLINSTGAYHTGVINAASHTAGANVVVNSVAVSFVGNTTTSPTITLANTGSFTIGNSSTTQTTALISVANSAGSANISPSGFSGNGHNLSVNASKIDTGTLPSARISGAYTGITQIGTLTGIAVSGNSSFDSGVLYVDGTNNRVGINNTSPDAELTITGSANVSGDLKVSGNLVILGNTVSSGTTEYNGTLNPIANGYQIGNNTNRWNLSAVDGNFSGNIVISTTVYINTTSLVYSGNTTTSPTITLANTGSFIIGNSTTTQTASIISIANSAGSANISPSGFSGNGFNITSINASSITNGTLPSARISGDYTGITQVGTLTGVTVTGNSNFDSGVLFVDGTNNRVGVNTTSPSVTLQIAANDAVVIPVGTTAQRPTGANGMIRYNSNTNAFEGYSGAWKQVSETNGGYYKGNNGAAGNTSNKDNLFRINSNTQSNNITISAGENAMAAGPITVLSGYTLTIETGGRVVIV